MLPGIDFQRRVWFCILNVVVLICEFSLERSRTRRWDPFGFGTVKSRDRKHFCDRISFTALLATRSMTRGWMLSDRWVNDGSATCGRDVHSQ